MVIRSEGVLRWHWKEENIEHVRWCERDTITSYSLDPYCDDDRGYLVEYGSKIKETSSLAVERRKHITRKMV